MPNLFKDGGGAGIGSYVVVFENGQLAEGTNLVKVRGAYDAGETIFVSLIDETTEEALIPASGWIDEENKLNLVARDFDDNKTYTLILTGDPQPEIIEAEVSEGIEIDGEPIPADSKIEEHTLYL